MKLLYLDEQSALQSGVESLTGHHRIQKRAHCRLWCNLRRHNHRTADASQKIGNFEGLTDDSGGFGFGLLW